VQWMADLRLRHQVVPTPDEAKPLPGPGGLLSGRVGFQSALSGIRGDVVPQLKQATPAFTIEMVAWPKGPKGRVTRGTPFLAGILKPSKHPQEAWEWVKFMTTLPAQRTWLAMQGTLSSRKSVTQSPAFQQSLLPWESAAVYEESLRTLRVTKLPPKAADIDTLWRTALTAVYGGEKPAGVAMAEIKPAIDDLLQAKR
jgi:ABC-type glycerol-3-phosphate transport system substrate-binding protein